MSARLVYFIRPVGILSPVKIGCSNAPQARLSQLTTWSPFPLEIVATTPGDEAVERLFHQKFAACRSHREWFHATDELYDAIAAIKAGAFDARTYFRDVDRTKPSRRRVWSTDQREAMSLTARYSRCTGLIGVQPPDDVRAAVRSLFKLSGPGRAEAIALIEGFIADPARVGTVMPHEWAQQRFAKFLSRQAA